MMSPVNHNTLLDCTAAVQGNAIICLYNIRLIQVYSVLYCICVMATFQQLHSECLRFVPSKWVVRFDKNKVDWESDCEFFQSLLLVLERPSTTTRVHPQYTLLGKQWQAAIVPSRNRPARVRKNILTVLRTSENNGNRLLIPTTDSNK